jgi:putative addiction module component (TIGR02574 family)
VPDMASLPTSSDLARLSVSERLDLMDDIWESLGSNREAIPLPEWHVTEIKRRLAALAVDGNRGRPMDDVFAELKRRL